MTTEPYDDGPRLTGVTAQTHADERAHDSHDRLPVARFALGDPLEADEAAVVRALLATCTQCLDLVGEMQLVQRMTATSLAPARSRDFTITPEQARTLRPGAWARLLGRFSAPRVTALRPLAGATLAIGIVLVGASAVLPRDTSRAAPAPAPEAARVTGSASPSAMDTTAGMQADAASQGPHARNVAPQAKSSPGLAGTELMPQSSDAAVFMSVPSSPDPGASVTALVMRELSGPVEPESDLVLTTRSSGDVTTTALLILGVVLAAVSALVLILAWLARRATDPLLR